MAQLSGEIREIFGGVGSGETERQTDRQQTERVRDTQRDRDGGKAGKGVHASQCPWHCCLSLDFAGKTVSSVTVVSVNLCP